MLPYWALSYRKSRSSWTLITFPDGTQALIRVDKFEICETNSDCAFSFCFKCIRKAINLICCAKSNPSKEVEWKEGGGGRRQQTYLCHPDTQHNQSLPPEVILNKQNTWNIFTYITHTSSWPHMRLHPRAASVFSLFVCVCCCFLFFFSFHTGSQLFCSVVWWRCI